MGVAITDILSAKELDMNDLQGKKVAIDAFNFLYQFLTSIRGPDGGLLTDSKGNVTSHLVGLFSRTTKLLEKGIQCVFVFDGEAPELKKAERDRRRALKEQAQAAYDEAEKTQDVDAMKKFASRTTKLTDEMIEDAKALLTAMGVPIIQAPSEGEAQAAYMCDQGDVDYVASQDADAILFGAPRVIRNLSIAGKRKKAGKLAFKKVVPELITLQDTLNTLHLDLQKLRILSILVGTDFNVGGVHGIGPKKALKLVQENAADDIFSQVDWQFEYSWQEVYAVFDTCPILKEYTIQFDAVKEEKVKQVLCEKHEFSVDRVQSTLKKLMKKQESLAQTGLGDFM